MRDVNGSRKKCKIQNKNGDPVYIGKTSGFTNPSVRFRNKEILKIINIDIL